jgi:hypothetical protein
VLVAQLLIREQLVVTLELLQLAEQQELPVQLQLAEQQVLLVVPLEQVERLCLVQRFPLEHLAYLF